MGGTVLIEKQGKENRGTDGGARDGNEGAKDRRYTYPRWSSTIIRIARTAQMMMTKGHRNLHTRVQMYDFCENGA